MNKLSKQTLLKQVCVFCKNTNNTGDVWWQRIFPIKVLLVTDINVGIKMLTLLLAGNPGCFVEVCPVVNIEF